MNFKHKRARIAQRRDENEKEMVRRFTQLGGIWLPQAAGLGCDGIAIWRGQVRIVEVKNPSQPPSKRKLTDEERALQAECERVEAPYNIVLTLDDLLRLFE